MTPATIRLWVARHAPVKVPGVCYGQSDVPTSLDAEGATAVLIAQLADLAHRVERVWTSPWERTRAPAQLVARHLGVPLTVDPRLSELSFGEWEGRPYAELEPLPAFGAWMADWKTAAPPGGEPLEALRTRVRQWRDDVRAAGEIALAITHAGVIRALRAEARRVPYEAVVSEPVPPLVLEAAV